MVEELDWPEDVDLPGPAECLTSDLDAARRVFGELQAFTERLSALSEDVVARVGPVADLAERKRRTFGQLLGSMQTTADMVAKRPDLEETLWHELLGLGENLRESTEDAARAVAFMVAAIEAAETDPGATVTVRNGDTADSVTLSTSAGYARILADKTDNGEHLALARRLEARAVMLARSHRPPSTPSRSTGHRRPRYCLARSSTFTARGEDPSPSRWPGALQGRPCHRVGSELERTGTPTDP